jgi:hypothetical protein
MRNGHWVPRVVLLSSGGRAQYYSEDLHIRGFSERMRRKRAGSLQPASRRWIESAAHTEKPKRFAQMPEQPPRLVSASHLSSPDVLHHCHLVNMRGALTPAVFPPHCSKK